MYTGRPNRGEGVTVHLYADLLLQTMERCNSYMCWIVIYKVGSVVFKYME